MRFSRVLKLPNSPNIFKNFRGFYFILNYIKLKHFTQVLGVPVLCRVFFHENWPISANLNCFCYLGVSSTSTIFFHVHSRFKYINMKYFTSFKRVTHYSWDSFYLILANMVQFGLLMAALGYPMYLKNVSIFT